MTSKIVEDNELGKVILSNQSLEDKVKRNTTVTMGLGVIGVCGLILIGIGTFKDDKPLLLGTETGPIITDYSHVLEERTIEERMLVAEFTYKGLRRRTGISKVDGQQLEDWKGQITKAGVKTWANLGERWKEPNLVKPGFSRGIRVLSVVPDRASPYAFTVEAIESDSQVDEPRHDRSYRVRFTMYFTDPIVEGVSKLDSIVLHSEEVV